MELSTNVSTSTIVTVPILSTLKSVSSRVFDRRYKSFVMLVSGTTTFLNIFGPENMNVDHQ